VLFLLGENSTTSEGLGGVEQYESTQNPEIDNALEGMWMTKSALSITAQRCPRRAFSLYSCWKVEPKFQGGSGERAD
jgi:hypothetical protein